MLGWLIGGAHVSVRESARAAEARRTGLSAGKRAAGGVLVGRSNREGGKGAAGCLLGQAGPVREGKEEKVGWVAWAGLGRWDGHGPAGVWQFGLG